MESDTAPAAVQLSTGRSNVDVSASFAIRARKQRASIRRSIWLRPVERPECRDGALVKCQGRQQSGVTLKEQPRAKQYPRLGIAP